MMHWMPFRQLLLKRSLAFTCLCIVLVVLHKYYYVAEVTWKGYDQEAIETVNFIKWDVAGKETYEIPVSNGAVYDLKTWTRAKPGLPLCTARLENLKKDRPTDKQLVALEFLMYSYQNIFQPGGRYSPDDCQSKEKMALIIPFRDRHSLLPILLKTLIPMLYHQRLSFTIFVIEQNEPAPFNKGILFNAGVREALSLDSTFGCFIMHDVDMLPVNERNKYTCDPRGPLHFMAGLDKWGYNLLYENLTGGVLAFTKEQYEKVNGYSNLFFGWGSEDDDMTHRLKNKYGGFYRKTLSVGKYDMLVHSRNTEAIDTKSRRKLESLGPTLQDKDGYNSAKNMYRVTQVKKLALYTWINIEIRMEDVIQNAPRPILPFFQSILPEYRNAFGSRVDWANIQQWLDQHINTTVFPRISR